MARADPLDFVRGRTPRRVRLRRGSRGGEGRRGARGGDQDLGVNSFRLRLGFPRYLNRQLWWTRGNLVSMECLLDL